MALRLRLAEDQDLMSILELYCDLHVDAEPLADTPEFRQLWRTILRQPGLTCVVGEYDGKLVSSCCIAILPNLTHGGRPYALVENVVTHRDFRTRGFATAVVKHALSLAWAEGCYKAMLLTGSHRPETHRFYEACGFRSDDKAGFVARP